MLKSELIEMALNMGLEVDDTMTKTEISDLIESANEGTTEGVTEEVIEETTEESDDSPKYDFSKVKELSITQTRNMTQHQIKEYCRVK